MVLDGVFDNCLDFGVNICCDVDSSISIVGDVCFIFGDIFGFDGYEDDYSLCFYFVFWDVFLDFFGEDSVVIVIVIGRLLEDLLSWVFFCICFYYFILSILNNVLKCWK